ncbi:hypothetical protein WJ972_03245 [Achromobacter insuavis]
MALQTSGLFYESHLTDMVFGRSNPAQLQQEPQAKLTRSGVPSEADLARPRADSAGTSASRSAATRRRRPAAPIRPRPARRSAAFTRISPCWCASSSTCWPTRR